MRKMLIHICCILTGVWGFQITPALGRIFTKGFRVYYDANSYSYTKSYETLMPRSFGFLQNAEIHFSMACPSRSEAYGRPDIWLLFCSTTEETDFSRMSSSDVNRECQHLAKGENTQGDTYCQRQLVQYNHTQVPQYSYSRRMEYNRFYTVILLQCSNQNTESNFTNKLNFTCMSKLMAMNPNGEHLSSDEIPLPLVYFIINLIWASLLTLWVFNWVVYFKFSNRLHRLISSAPVFKVLLVVLVLLWWQQVANTGIESHDLSTIRSFVESIERSLLFMTLMVIAEGWGVVRCYFRYYRWTSLFLIFLLFATSLMGVHWIHKYFLAFSICCVVFIMYKTLKWTSSNIELIRRRQRKIKRFLQRHSLRYTGSATIEAQLAHKHDIYYRFRIVCTAFSLVYVMAVTFSMLLHEYEYIRALVYEVPELAVYVSIGWLFRLRNFEPYHHIEVVAPREDVSVLSLPDVCHDEVDPSVVLGTPLHEAVEREGQTRPRRRISRWRHVLSL